MSEERKRKKSLDIIVKVEGTEVKILEEDDIYIPNE